MNCVKGALLFHPYPLFPGVFQGLLHEEVSLITSFADAPLDIAGYFRKPIVGHLFSLQSRELTAFTLVGTLGVDRQLRPQWSVFEIIFYHLYLAGLHPSRQNIPGAFFFFAGIVRRSDVNYRLIDYTVVAVGPE